MVPGEGTFTYCCSRVVNLVAVADEGYHFVEWTGDVSTIANVNAATTTITLYGQHFITANFAQDQPIQTWYDLDAVRNNLTGSYTLMNDLNSTSAGYTELASPTANGGKGWQPIGNYTGGNFTGSFDGQGYEIKDLFINRPGEDGIGLFGYVGEEGIVKNVGVVEASITSIAAVGGLVAFNKGGTVSNCYVTGSITGTSIVIGGLVGSNEEGIVSNCYATGTISGSSMIGGLVGDNRGTVSDSYSTGNVTGDDFVGGLVGSNYDEGTVNNCYSNGNVTGDAAIGGLVGVTFGGTVSNSYATGSVIGVGENRIFIGGLVGDNYVNLSNSYSTCSVTGNSSVGGLVGHNSGNLSNSYSTGSVTGNTTVGGLVGLNDWGGTVTNSFWDTQTSGQSTSAGGTGKNTTQMQDIITFSGATWDIVAVVNSGARNTSYIWNIVNTLTYPFLSWQPA